MKKLLFICLVLGACTTKPIENTQPKTNTPTAVVEQTITPEQNLVSKVKAISYYSAVDFNLIPGTIIGFTPDLHNEWPEEESNKEVYVKISEPNGHIAVLRIDRRAWLVLYEGDVLR